MHMSDALLSPAVGGTMYAASAGSIGYAVKRIASDPDFERKIPMCGVMGAFIFAGQMVNFTIPLTGSSGHITGGILLAAVLGPFPALIAIASVLLIQCLVFADGGLLAYGANVFNMGVIPCLLAYSFIYRPIAAKRTRTRVTVASIAACVIGLQLGAFFVVLETLASGITELPFAAFLTLMQPIHLAIGLVEGILTALTLNFILAARPALLSGGGERRDMKPVAVFAAFTALIGGGLSLFASGNPDGLEWSIAGVTENLREVHTTGLFGGYGESNLQISAAGVLGSLSVAAALVIIGLAVRFFVKRKREG